MFCSRSLYQKNKKNNKLFESENILIVLSRIFLIHIPIIENIFSQEKNKRHLIYFFLEIAIPKFVILDNNLIPFDFVVFPFFCLIPSFCSSMGWVCSFFNGFFTCVVSLLVFASVYTATWNLLELSALCKHPRVCAKTSSNRLQLHPK